MFNNIIKRTNYMYLLINANVIVGYIIIWVTIVILNKTTHHHNNKN